MTSKHTRMTKNNTTPAVKEKVKGVDLYSAIL